MAASITSVNNVITCKLRGIAAALLILSLCFLPVSLVSAQDRGAAFFAMQSPTFPCNNALKAFETGQLKGLAILWRTFGSDNRCLERWSQTNLDQSRVLEIHLSNEACRRNKRCLEGELLQELSVEEYNRRLVSRDEKVLAALASRIDDISQAVSKLNQSNLELILSTGLEDNFSLDAYKVVLELMRAHWKYKVVRNPVESVKDLSKLGADYIEIHGDKPSFLAEDACLANLDGVDIDFPHRKSGMRQHISWEKVQAYASRYTNRCRVTFFWSGPWQGIYKDQGVKFIPPLKRVLEVSLEDISALRKLN